MKIEDCSERAQRILGTLINGGPAFMCGRNVTAAEELVETGVVRHAPDVLGSKKGCRAYCVV